MPHSEQAQKRAPCAPGQPTTMDATGGPPQAGQAPSPTGPARRRRAAPPAGRNAPAARRRQRHARPAPRPGSRRRARRGPWRRARQRSAARDAARRMRARLPACRCRGAARAGDRASRRTADSAMKRLRSSGGMPNCARALARLGVRQARARAARPARDAGLAEVGEKAQIGRELVALGERVQARGAARRTMSADRADGRTAASRLPRSGSGHAAARRLALITEPHEPHGPRDLRRDVPLFQRTGFAPGDCDLRPCR